MAVLTTFRHSGNLTYREELDCLRALAVFLVIIYHAKFTVHGINIFPGGFIGVDVFFVLSGYLISRILFSQLKTDKNILLYDFYARRARRILPALFVVLLSSLPIAWFSLTPGRLFEFAESIGTSVLFISNLYFQNVATQYGAESSLLKPSLHTWSLSVEEQFYIIFPIIIMLASRYAKHRLYSVLICLTAISFFYANYESYSSPTKSFFAPLSRFWELGLGSLLAWNELHTKLNRQSKANIFFVFIGLAAIVLSAMIFDENTYHPSVATLLPISGALLIIRFGSSNNFMKNVFLGRVLIGTGLISYSLYLWHYPIFAYFRINFGEPTGYHKILLIWLTVSLAVLTYKFVEVPFRKKMSKRKFRTLIVLGFLIIMAPVLFIVSQKQFTDFWLKFGPNRIVQHYALISDAFARSFAIETKCKFGAVELSNDQILSRYNECKAKFETATVILGDSHAINIFNAAVLSEDLQFVVGLVQGGCRPINCAETGKNVYQKFLEINHIFDHKDSIIFHQSGSHFVSDASGKTDSNQVFIGGEYAVEAALIKQTSDFLTEIAASSSASITWLGPFWEYGFDPHDIVRDAVQGRDIATYAEINPRSIEILQNVEDHISDLNMRLVAFLPFEAFYKMNINAEVEYNGGDCFQFRDRDHFSSCGEKIMSSRANWALLNED